MELENNSMYLQGKSIDNFSLKKAIKKPFRTATQLFTATPRAVQQITTGKKVVILDPKKSVKETMSESLKGKSKIAVAIGIPKVAVDTVTKPLANSIAPELKKPVLKGGEIVSTTLKATGTDKIVTSLGSNLTPSQKASTASNTILLGSQTKKFDDPIFAPLVPLDKPITKILQNNGIAVKPDTKLDVKADLFYNKVVKSNFEPKLDTINNAEGNNSVLKGVIVTAIVNYFKNSKQKKDQGKDLSTTEKIAAGAVEQVEKEVQKEVNNEISKNIGETILYNRKFQLFVVFVLGLLIFRALRKQN